MPFRVIFAKLLRIAECRAGQQVQLSHLRAYQTLDMTIEAWLTRGSQVDRDTGIIASTLERPTAEVDAVVDVNHVWQSGDWPGVRNLAFSQSSRLVED